MLANRMRSLLTMLGILIGTALSFGLFLMMD